MFGRAHRCYVVWLCLLPGLTTCAVRSPSLAEEAARAAKPPRCEISRRAVLDDPRMSLGLVTHIDRLVDWLGQRGFERLDGEKLPAWMAQRIARGDAYGSVVVLPRVVSPLGLFEGPPARPLWLRYLESGGRIVHLGGNPWASVEPPQPRPSHVEWGSLGLNLLNMQWVWTNDARGFSATEAARAWGVESVDGAGLGIALAQVTQAFHVYENESGQVFASDWFRNVRADRPWSGLIKLLDKYEAEDDAVLRTVWRAAHFCGHAVQVPALPPRAAAAPVAPLTFVASASGVVNRHEFVRGEAVELSVTPRADLALSELRFELLQQGRVLVQQLQAASELRFLLDTSPFADGGYTWRVSGLQGERVIASSEHTIGIRYLPPEGFNFEVWYQASNNPRRADLELADIRAAGFELYAGFTDVGGLDGVVRNHLAFSTRVMPELPQMAPLEIERQRSRARLDPQLQPMVQGSAVLPSLAYPATRELMYSSVKRGLSDLAGLPSLRPYVLANDDYGMYYGWDYSAHVRAAYRAETGRDPPTSMQLPAASGAIADDEPWLRWWRWTLRHVNAAYNGLETKAALAVRRDLRVGPITGAPLVQLWEPSQYPSYSFGREGFNLISHYYYNNFWQPVLTHTFWMEIGRMGNRELPQWIMPNLTGSAAYTRNSLFHILAGGVDGIVYFRYEERTPEAWSELRRWGPVIQRIGQVELQLRPSERDIGLVNSFTTNCYESNHTLSQVDAYANLLRAHYSVELLSEDELASGRAKQYRAILLHRVKYLSRAAYRALEAYIARGGIVLADSTVPFNVPGAKRLTVSLTSGREQDDPAEALTSMYGWPERIARVAQALSAHVQPRFTTPSSTLVATQFQAGGVPYTWFVDTYEATEHVRSRAWVRDPAKRDPAALRAWEASAIGARELTTTASFASLPGVPYDLVRGGKLELSGPGGVKLRMSRLGGALIAWLPQAITGLALDAPERTRAREPVQLRAALQSGAEAAPGVLPIQFTLSDPKGRVALESGVRVTRAGVAVLEWTPAVNDPPGTWTITAKDLAAGFSATRRIQLD